VGAGHELILLRQLVELVVAGAQLSYDYGRDDSFSLSVVDELKDPL